MFELIKVENDLFDIAKRLREIDEGYVLYFNPKHTRFEVHARGALQVVVPFLHLDSRTITHVRRTRIENNQKLLKEMEEQNLKLEKMATRQTAEKMSEIIM